MTIAKKLVAARRWMLWAPVPVALVLCGGSVTDFGKILVGSLPLRIPFWLAWWLSDGFETVTVGGGNLSHRPGVNAATGHACVVLTHSDTGAPVAWLGGDSRAVDQR